MIAFLRALWQRAFGLGYATGYRAGVVDGAYVMPDALVAAFWTWKEASEGKSLLDERRAEKAIFATLDQMIIQEMERE